MEADLKITIESRSHKAHLRAIIDKVREEIVASRVAEDEEDDIYETI